MDYGLMKDFEELEGLQDQDQSLNDVVIDDDVMLGANTLVPPGKHLLSGYLYLGAPAKQVRRLTSEEVDFLKYSAEHYVRLKENYLA